MMHTPTPWIKSQNEITDVAGETIATVSRRQDGYVQGNLALIAAAPELLAALRECITVYEVHRDAQPTGRSWPDPNYITHARTAIAQAIGEEVLP